MRAALNIRTGLTLICLGVMAVDAGPTWAADPADGHWYKEVERAVAAAKRTQLPLLVHVSASWCGPCRRMDREFLEKPTMLGQLGTRFIGLKLDADRHEELLEKLSVRSVPTDLIVDTQGNIISRSEGYQDQKTYFSRLARIEAVFKRSQTSRIARDRADSQSSGNPQRNETPVPRPRPDESRTTTPSSPKPARRLVGLDGFSPIALYKFRRWERGEPRFAAEYKGIVYYLSSAVERREFEESPGRYAPRLLGCDPVILEKSDRAIAGSTKFGAYFDDELYLFTGAESRARFKQNPLQYVRTRHVLRVDEIESQPIERQ